MAARTQEVCRLLVERYDGRAERLWDDVPDGAAHRGPVVEDGDLGDVPPGEGARRAAEDPLDGGVHGDDPAVDVEPEDDVGVLEEGRRVRSQACFSV